MFWMLSKSPKSRFTHLKLKDSRAAGLATCSRIQRPRGVRCAPLGSWNTSIRSILISDNEQVCPAADRQHGDVHSLGNDDKLERPAI
jgi:hypothetical protein